MYRRQFIEKRLKEINVRISIRPTTNLTSDSEPESNASSDDNDDNFADKEANINAIAPIEVPKLIPIDKENLIHPITNANIQPIKSEKDPHIAKSNLPTIPVIEQTLIVDKNTSPYKRRSKGNAIHSVQTSIPFSASPKPRALKDITPKPIYPNKSSGNEVKVLRFEEDDVDIDSITCILDYECNPISDDKERSRDQTAPENDATPVQAINTNHDNEVTNNFISLPTPTESVDTNSPPIPTVNDKRLILRFRPYLLPIAIIFIICSILTYMVCIYQPYNHVHVINFGKFRSHNQQVRITSKLSDDMTLWKFISGSWKPNTIETRLELDSYLLESSTNNYLHYPSSMIRKKKCICDLTQSRTRTYKIQEPMALSASMASSPVQNNQLFQYRYGQEISRAQPMCHACGESSDSLKCYYYWPSGSLSRLLTT